MELSLSAGPAKASRGQCVPGDVADRANIRHIEECPGCADCDALMEFYSGCHICNRTALMRTMTFDTVSGWHTCDACAAVAGRTAPKTFWHCTPRRNLASIQEHGLRPGPKGWSYLSDCLDTAANYENGFDEPTVLLAVDATALDQSLLGPDDDDVSDLLRQAEDPRGWKQLSWEESLKLCSQCTYSGHIPPSAIREEV